VRVAWTYVGTQGPTLDPEPAYTPGTDNPLTWSPITAVSEVTYEVQRAADAAFTQNLVTATTTLTTYTFTSLSHDQTYYYRVRGVDAWGWTSDWSNVVSSTQDAVAPTAGMEALAPYQASPSFAVSWEGSDDGSGLEPGGPFRVQYRAEGGAWTLWLDWVAQTSANFSGQDGVTYAFRVRARDAVGNLSPWSAPVSTTVDTEAPLITDFQVTPSAFSPNGDGVLEVISVTATISDANPATWTIGVHQGVTGGGPLVAGTEGQGATVAWTWDGSGNQGDGDHTVVLTATDSTDLWTTAEAPVLLDTTPPSVTIRAPAVSAASLRFTVSWSGSDAHSGVRDYDVQYRVGTGEWVDWYVGATETEAPFVGQTGQTYTFRVRAWDNVNNASGWAESAPVTVSAVRKNYFFGGQLVATRLGGAVYYIHSDHLGSVSLTTDASAAVVAETRYLPYGGERWTSGAPVTDFGFTGQRREAGFGLYHYRARYYSPGLGRFVSPDSLVPQPGNPQGLNRYSYVLNRPLQGGDPTGHQGPEPGVGVLPPLQQPIDPVALRQMAEALAQGGTYGLAIGGAVAGAAAVGGGSYILAHWAMQDVGPDYALPPTVDPGSPQVQPTWVLAGTSTLTTDTRQGYAQQTALLQDEAESTGIYFPVTLKFADKQRQIERELARQDRQRAGLTQPQLPKPAGPPQGPPGQKPPRPPDDDNEIWRAIGEALKNPNTSTPEKVLIVGGIIAAAVAGKLN